MSQDTAGTKHNGCSDFHLSGPCESRQDKGAGMKKLLIYSHDTFGLGNIRRIMNIATYLHRAVPDLSILIVT